MIRRRIHLNSQPPPMHNDNWMHAQQPLTSVRIIRPTSPSRDFRLRNSPPSAATRSASHASPRRNPSPSFIEDGVPPSDG